MTKDSKGMKIAVLVFSAALIIIAAAATFTAADRQNPAFPVNSNIGGISISWHYPDYEELVTALDLIVIATVTNKTGIWDTDDGKKPMFWPIRKSGILTEYTFKPEDVLKGNTTTFIGRIRGGTADGYTQDANPTPSFETGDKVLLFLKTNEDADGNRILWYYLSWPTAFTENRDGKFENPCYDALSIELLKQDVTALNAV
ncbi:MAG: hypothetical protein LBU81_04305 [Methanosarcinales archaeon]|jgi:hypothetical protein|nr:hypothetical protein [Methanosarcinales archaeon]